MSRHLAVKLVAFVLAGFGMGMHPASAQVPTVPPLPPLPYVSPPAAAQPVLELLAPTIYPQCGTAALAVFLAGSSAPQIAPQLQGLSTPVFVICGSVPRPQQQLTCLVDLQTQEVINTVTSQAGAALPLGLHPEGDVVEQAITVVDKLPPPAKNAGLQTIVPRVLVCTAATQVTPVQGDYSMGPPAPYAPPPLTSGPYIPGSIPGYVPPPPAAQPPPTLPGTVPRATAAGDAVIYTAVWLLPLALLAFGGYFGGALTREITLSPSA